MLSKSQTPFISNDKVGLEKEIELLKHDLDFLTILCNNLR